MSGVYTTKATVLLITQLEWDDPKALPLVLRCKLAGHLGKYVLIHSLKWPTDSNMVDNVVSNTVVGQYIKMLCLFLTSPPDFPLYWG